MLKLGNIASLYKHTLPIRDLKHLVKKTAPENQSFATRRRLVDNRSQSVALSYKADVVFEAAERHSIRIKFLKIILPLIATLIALLFCWFTFFSAPSHGDLVIINGGDDNGKLTMTQPKLEGYTSTNQRYALSAQKAIQNPSNTGMIELQNISAILPLGGRGEAHVSAEAGFYDNINGRLNLTKPFSVKTSDGIVARLQNANINLATTQLTTSDPVDIKRGGQHLKAGRLQISNKGQVLSFHDGVRLVIDNTISH